MHASADFSVYEGTEHHSDHVAEATHHLIDKSHREGIEVYSGKYFPGLVLCGPGLLTKSHILIFLEPHIMAPSAGDQTFKHMSMEDISSTVHHIFLELYSGLLS